MTAGELLSRIASIQKEIDFRKEKIEDLNERAEGLSVRSPDVSGVQRSDVSPMATAVGRKIDLEREIEELLAEQIRLTSYFDRIDDVTLRRLLFLRYVRNSRWGDISRTLGYCVQHLHRLQRKATEKLDQVLKDATQ